ncbi:MAG: hypothetical protein LC745_10810, partial [Planctomycetia bacterium]|nr:hypothetical protein [Planctomycetia bacterium]
MFKLKGSLPSGSDYSFDFDIVDGDGNVINGSVDLNAAGGAIGNEGTRLRDAIRAAVKAKTGSDAAATAAANLDPTNSDIVLLGVKYKGTSTAPGKGTAKGYVTDALRNDNGPY